MSANILVSGLESQMGGLIESQATFRKHNRDVGDALMNISGVGTVTGDPVHKDEPRPPYQFQEYPFMLYKPGQENPILVHSAGEKSEKLREGWRVEPVFKPQIAVLDPATEKKVMIDRDRAQQAQISLLGETIERQNTLLASLADRLEALENRKK